MVALSLNLLPAGRILTRDPTEVNAHIIHCQPNFEMSSFSQSRNVRFMVSSPPWIVLVLAATACATDDSASA
jgi:hypothetical protein